MKFYEYMENTLDHCFVAGVWTDGKGYIFCKNERDAIDLVELAESMFDVEYTYFWYDELNKESIYYDTFILVPNDECSW